MNVKVLLKIFKSVLQMTPAEQRAILGLVEAGNFSKQRECPGCGAGKNEYTVCDCDIEAVSKDMQVLQTWSIKKLQNFGGTVADELVLRQLRGKLSQEHNELLEIYEGLVCHAYIGDSTMLEEHPRELEDFLMLIGKAIESSSEVIDQIRLENENAMRTVEDIKEKYNRREQRLKEMLDQMDKIEKFKNYCFACFQYRFSTNAKKGIGFWHEVETYILAPFGFVLWLDYKLLKYLSKE